MFPRVAAPEELRFVEVATSTHNHTDHLDAETLNGMQPRHLVIPEANRAFVTQRLGCDPGWPIGLRPGESASVGPFRFHAVPAAHEQLSDECLGYVVEMGRYRLYHSGDTLIYDGMADVLRPFAADLAFLPINGKVGNMNHRDAAWLGKQIGARCVIPCHYDMFEFNTADPRDFAEEAEALGLTYRVLPLGGRYVSSY
jgi:L-ascorbate metabolism protein UlaG (beta-lactamase superfamily)